MKLSAAAVLALLSTAVAAVVLGLLILRIPTELLPQALSVLHREQRSGHELLLTEVHDLYRFHTVEYIYRSVFPYDYMAPHLSLASILRSIRAGSGSIADMLNEEEQRYLDAYNISLQAGLRTDTAAAEFVVVTVVVRAGFDLADTVFARPHEATPEELSSVFSVEEVHNAATGARLRIARMTTPPAVITDLRVEDVNPETYPYPDVSLSPDGWRSIAQFVRERARSETIGDGILRAAEQNGHRLLETLLLQLGYDRVELRTGNPGLSHENAGFRD
ncbi:MAG: hypothetical protein EA428_02460 [Spirochaetaceae bacterium]|nr:MAG: hypothetical protein EA428_02460 [Spirochaetaceae bacterium]